MITVKTTWSDLKLDLEKVEKKASTNWQYKYYYHYIVTNEKIVTKQEAEKRLGNPIKSGQKDFFFAKDSTDREFCFEIKQTKNGFTANHLELVGIWTDTPHYSSIISR